MEELQEVLQNGGVAPETIEQVAELLNKGGLHWTKEPNLQIRYDKAKGEIATLKESVKAMEEQAKALTDQLAKAKTPEDVTKEVETYKEQIKALEEARVQEQKDYYLKELVKDQKGKDYKLIKSLVDLNEITKGDNGLSGGEDQLNKVKEQYPYLFETEEVKTEDPTPNFGATDNPTANDTNEQVDAWTKAVQDKYGN